MSSKPIQVLFPSDPEGKIKYYGIHYKYLLNILHEVQKDEKNRLIVNTCDLPRLEGNNFLIYIDGFPVVIDFSDHLTIYKNLKRNQICFKYHYSRKHHKKYKNVVPIGPISFHNWEVYYRLREHISYSCNNDIVLNNQRPGGDAVERRNKVQELLRSTYKDNVDTRWYVNKESFWSLINNCLVSVCIPGARNDMLDRGQFQYMALGCCTISPKLTTVLAFNRTIKPGTHYVECKPDYSDLINRIEHCKKNRDVCRTIGLNVAELFSKTSTPIKIWEWMLRNVNNQRNNHG